MMSSVIFSLGLEASVCPWIPIGRRALQGGAQADARDEMEMTAAMHAKAFSHRAVIKIIWAVKMKLYCFSAL